MPRREYTSRGQAEIVLDGVEFRAVASVFDLAEMFGQFRDLDTDTPEGADALAEIFRRFLGDDQYPTFREHCRTHGTDANTLMEILTDAIEDLSGGKAPAPSLPSSAGLPTTGRTLRVVSAGGAIAEYPVDEARAAALAEAVEDADNQDKTRAALAGLVATG